MGDVTQRNRSHYSGLDADKTSITGEAGDKYSATDTGKDYYWNNALGAWKPGPGYEFVERLCTVADFDQTGLTTDGTWKVDGLDLSAIVPAGAIAVLISLSIIDDAANSDFGMRRDAVNVLNSLTLRTQVANIWDSGMAILSIDTDRKLDYMGANLAFTGISIAVLGWFI